MKLQYPAGVAMDDLDIGQNYKLTFRSKTLPIVGEFRELKLKRQKPPRIVIMPRGNPHIVQIPINQIAEIAVADIDLSNSDYSNDDPDPDLGEVL